MRKSIHVLLPDWILCSDVKHECSSVKHYATILIIIIILFALEDFLLGELSQSDQGTLGAFLY